MDIDEVHGAVHEIEMMVAVLLDAVVKLQAPDTNPQVFEVSRDEGEMISFAAFHIDKRVTALRGALNPPSATIVRIGGGECAWPGPYWRGLASG